MSRTISIAPVRKTIVVQATPLRAFEVFTAHIDRWWPKSHGIGSAPVRESVIEPFVGGRWFSTCEDGTVVTLGHVRAWQPGERFTVSWEISAQWKPDARPEFTSEVDVIFASVADGRTRVELEHRDFERMGAVDGERMRNDVDRGWPGLLELFAKSVDAANKDTF